MHPPLPSSQAGRRHGAGRHASPVSMLPPSGCLIGRARDAHLAAALAVRRHSLVAGGCRVVQVAGGLKDGWGTAGRCAAAPGHVHTKAALHEQSGASWALPAAHVPSAAASPPLSRLGAWPCLGRPRRCGTPTGRLFRRLCPRSRTGSCMVAAVEVKMPEGSRWEGRAARVLPVQGACAGMASTRGIETCLPSPPLNSHAVSRVCIAVSAARKAGHVGVWGPSPQMPPCTVSGDGGPGGTSGGSGGLHCSGLRQAWLSHPLSVQPAAHSKGCPATKWTSPSSTNHPIAAWVGAAGQRRVAAKQADAEARATGNIPLGSTVRCPSQHALPLPCPS